MFQREQEKNVYFIYLFFRWGGRGTPIRGRRLQQTGIIIIADDMSSLCIELVCTATTYYFKESNIDQPRKVAKPARGQLNREIKCPCRCIPWYVHT